MKQVGTAEVTMRVRNCNVECIFVALLLLLSTLESISKRPKHMKNMYYYVHSRQLFTFPAMPRFLPPSPHEE